MISSEPRVWAPFKPLRNRGNTLSFRVAALLGDDDFALVDGAFFEGFFPFTTVDAGIRLDFAAFFSAGRPRPCFFECFAKVYAVEELL